MATIKTTAELSLLVNADLTRLTSAEVDAYIADIQSAPFRLETVTETDWTVDPDTGEDVSVEVNKEKVVYEAHPAADRAMEELIRHFMRLLHKMAATVNPSSQGRGLTYEDAFGYLTEAFINFARNEYVPGQANGNFIQLIPSVLSKALGQRERDVHLIRIPSNTAGRFTKLLRANDYDTEAAYQEAKSAKIAPTTFLAIINAMSLSDNPLDGGHRESYFDNELHGWDETLFNAGYTAPDPAEEILQSALVSYAFAVVGEQMEAALRLKFGFNDDHTGNLRRDAGFDQFHADVMKTEDVAHVLRAAGILGMSRSNLDKHIAKALQTAREAIEASEYDGTSHRSTGR